MSLVKAKLSPFSSVDPYLSQTIPFQSNTQILIPQLNLTRRASW
jgi:hypothetical protein